MISYWLIYLIPAVLVLSPFKGYGQLERVGWVSLVLVTACFIGLRQDVGGDWENYLHLFQKIEATELSVALGGRSKGYGLLNWIMAKAGLGIYGVNLACAVIGVVSLRIFCARQKDPLLAWVIFIPYLVLVVGMGYTRQATAVFLVMAGYAWLLENKRIAFILVVFSAMLFHKSALVALPLVLLTLPWGEIIGRLRESGAARLSSQTWVMLWAILALLVITPVLYWDNIENYLDNYVYRDHWKSAGGSTRVAMNVVPALLLILRWFSSRDKEKGEEIPALWIVLSLAAIVTVLLLLVSSTVADRLSVYLVAIQGVVFSQVPYWTKTPVYHGLLKAGVVGSYGLVLFVWFSYADHAYEWLPYENIFLR
jgi:hypothetical protein